MNPIPASSSTQLQTELFTLLIVVIVIARFLVRELRARTVKLSRLWMRPALLVGLTAFFIFATLPLAPWSKPLLLPAIGGGIIAGIIVGVLVAASTKVEPTGKPGLVRLHGNWVTVAIWIGALVLRIGVRFAFGGGSLTSQSPAVNGATLTLVAAAFATFAILIFRRAKDLGLAEPGTGLAQS